MSKPTDIAQERWTRPEVFGTPAAPRSLAPAGERFELKVRLHPDVAAQLRYWAARAGVSMNTFVADAVGRRLATQNQDYDLPVLEVQRLNEVVDQLKALSENTANLERVVHDGLGSLLALARGDDYLLHVDAEV